MVWALQSLNFGALGFKGFPPNVVVRFGERWVWFYSLLLVASRFLFAFAIPASGFLLLFLPFVCCSWLSAFVVIGCLHFLLLFSLLLVFLGYRFLPSAICLLRLPLFASASSCNLFHVPLSLSASKIHNKT